MARPVFITLEAYIKMVAKAIKEANMDLLEVLLSLSHEHMKSPHCHVKDFRTQCNTRIDEPWDDFLDLHLNICTAISERDSDEAFLTQADFVNAVANEFIGNDDLFIVLLRMLARVCRDLRRLAFICDRQAQTSGNAEVKWKYSEDAAESLKTVFKQISSDKRTDLATSKKNAMLHIGNQMLKISNKIGRPEMTSFMFKQIENVPTDIYNHFPKSHYLTYRYFQGKDAFDSGDIENAIEGLETVFQHCPRSARVNKIASLLYLLPCRMSKGSLPKQDVLRRLDLLKYKGLSDAVIECNLRLFETTMRNHKKYFLEHMAYSFLQSVKVIIYRNILKKLYLVEGKPKQLSFDHMTVALALSGMEDVTDEDSEAIIANLIYKDMVKGYMAHSVGRLVLGKDPFPKLPLPQKS